MQREHRRAYLIRYKTIRPLAYPGFKRRSLMYVVMNLYLAVSFYANGKSVYRSVDYKENDGYIVCVIL